MNSLRFAVPRRPSPSAVAPARVSAPRSLPIVSRTRGVPRKGRDPRSAAETLGNGPERPVIRSPPNQTQSRQNALKRATSLSASATPYKQEVARSSRALPMGENSCNTRRLADLGYPGAERMFLGGVPCVRLSVRVCRGVQRAPCATGRRASHLPSLLRTSCRTARWPCCGRYQRSERTSVGGRVWLTSRAESGTSRSARRLATSGITQARAHRPALLGPKAQGDRSAGSRRTTRPL